MKAQGEERNNNLSVREYRGILDRGHILIESQAKKAGLHLKTG
jgi:hypothetical protein